MVAPSGQLENLAGGSVCINSSGTSSSLSRVGCWAIHYSQVVQAGQWVQMVTGAYDDFIRYPWYGRCVFGVGVVGFCSVIWLLAVILEGFKKGRCGDQS